MEESDITALLSEWAEGNQTALARLAPLVYPDLRALAHSFFRQERQDHTLQPTALVSELFMKVMARRKLTCENRRHFYALSARPMRYALIDHARTSGAEKRGRLAPLVYPDLRFLARNFFRRERPTPLQPHGSGQRALIVLVSRSNRPSKAPRHFWLIAVDGVRLARVLLYRQLSGGSSRA